MATVIDKPKPDSAPQPDHGSQEQLVDQQIGRTRRALKLVDVTVGLITLAIGVLAYLLTMSILEHWVIPGGWSDGARFMLFAALIVGCVWYSWRKFWPLLRQPINPAFAALTIEQSSPSLKNSLLNLLLLRNRKREMSRQVYQAIETQAAQGLSQVRMETVVDRSAILRLGYILVALTAACVLYRVLSPKDLFSSAGRVLLPWSNIAMPSRVTISDVTPGDARTARGDQLKVSAEILGLEEDEPVQLLYSTADQQIVKQTIPMTVSSSGTLFSCSVPAKIGGGDRRGVQQDFTYWIEAGDARSPRYQINVFARPTMVVNKLRYDYPAYTGYPSREVEHTGDIRAVEGTRVTVFAQANKPIKSAHIDFGADGRHDLLMNSTDLQSTATFPLGLREDRRTPEHRSYVLKYTTIDGNRNERPAKYQIDVQPDYAPEIQLLLPEEPVLEVAVNQEVNFELEARDPDFALGQVILMGQVGDDQRLQEMLLDRTHTGKFVGKARKTPEQMGLKPGDVLEYWGAAADNRRPEPNLAYSAHRKIRVVGPWRGDGQGNEDQEGEGEQQGEGGNSNDGEGGEDGQAGGGEQGGESGEGQEGAEGQSGSGDQGGEPSEDNQQQNGGQAGSEGEQEGNNDSQGNANGNSPSNDSQNESGESSDQQDDGGDPSDTGSSGEGGEQGKVSSEGDDDGTAFDRMAKHFEEQDGKSGEGQSQPDGNAEQQPNEGSPEGNQGEGQESQNEKAGDKPESEQQAEKKGADQQRTSEGEGAKGEPAPGDEQQGEQQESEQQQEGESPDGEMSREQGEAGAGDNSGKQEGTPNPDGGKKPKDKQGDQGDGPDEENSEAPAKSRDQSESDSEGGESGDRSGGGKEGAGQQADESGKGGAGENEAADEGAGKSSEQGEGETGEQAGDKDQADGETGESSEDQQGNGSKQSQKPGQQEGGQNPSEGQNGDQADSSDDAQAGERNDQKPNEQPPADQENNSAESNGQPGDPSSTGGKAGTPPESELLPPDQANLDYAKKQTDLILERLEDQLKKKEVDRSLLEKLGWSQEELQRFVDRWKGLKSQAEQDTSGSDDLNDALRSLGLNPNRRTGFNSKLTKDKLRDLQEAYRGRVPLEYQEQINRYIKGTANTQEKE